jgi:hypothetical protein
MAGSPPFDETLDPRHEGSVPDWAVRYRAAEFAPWALTVDLIGLTVDPETRDLEALLVRRGLPPYAGLLAWPGGFVDRGKDKDARAAALRELREETGQVDPEYLETLDTYESNGRDPRQFSGAEDPDGSWRNTGVRVATKAFLTLFRKADRVLEPEAGEDAASAHWVRVYDALPWEDLRQTRGSALVHQIRDRLMIWAAEATCADNGEREALRVRIRRAFDLSLWNEEFAPDRFRLLFEAGLVEEAWRDRWGTLREDRPEGPLYGQALAFDHRLMLADALRRLRGKIKYVPAALHALVGERFTLLDLQVVCEAAGGRLLHKSNFRRVVSRTLSYRLVEPTKEVREATGGRPALVHRFAPGVLFLERLDPSIRLPWVDP